MADNNMKKEFKDFIEELTIEICSNVCLDKISKINKEYQDNNSKFEKIYSKLEQALFDNKKNINDINKENIKILSEIKDSTDEILVEFDEKLNKGISEKKEIFNGIADRLNEIFKTAIENEENKKENNEMIKAVAIELMESHDALDNALQTVGENNRKHLESLNNKGQVLFEEYKKGVSKLNKEEREKFVKEINKEFFKQKDIFSKDLLDKVDIYTNKTFQKIIEDNSNLSRKLDGLQTEKQNTKNLNEMKGIINDNTQKIITISKNNSKVVNEEIKSVTERLNKNNINAGKSFIKIENLIKDQEKNLVNHFDENINMINAKINEVSSKIDNLENRIAYNEKMSKYILASIAVLAILTIIF